MAYHSVLIRWRAKDVVGDLPADPDVAPDAINLPSGTTVTITPAAPEIADLTSQPPVTYYPQKINAVFDSEGDLIGPVDGAGTLINPGVKGVAVIDPTDTNLQPHDFTFTIRVDFGGARGPITYSARLTTGEAPDPGDTGNPDQLTVYYLTRNAPVPGSPGNSVTQGPKGDPGDPGATINAQASVSGAYTIALSDGAVVELTVTGATTLALATPGGTQAVTITVCIIQDATGGRAVTVPTGVRWAEGVAPSLATAANSEQDLIFLWSPARGWRGYVAGTNMAAPA